MKRIFTTGLAALLSPLMGNAQWTQLSGMTQTVNTVYKSGANVMLGTSAGIMYTSNDGASWNSGTGITGITKSFTRSGNTVFVAGYEKIYSSIDDGVSWTALSTIYTNQYVNNVMIKNTNYLAGTNGNGVWYSTNSGSTWQAASGWNGKNTALVSKKNMFFASYAGSGNFQSSVTDGQTWSSPTGNNIKIGSSWPNIMSVAVKNDSIIFAGTNNGGNFTSYDGVYMSIDNGHNWTKKVNGLSTTAIKHLAITGNLIFAGTDGGGVFYSSDNGDNWTAFNTGLSNLTVNNLYIDGSTLYAATPTGVFKTEICDLQKSASYLPIFGSFVLNAGDSAKLEINVPCNMYHLMRNNVVVSSSTNNFFYLKENGDYRVIVEYSSTCKDTTDLFSLYLITGVREVASKQDVLLVYPNPSKDQIRVQSENLKPGTSYTLVDQVGRTVLSGKLYTNTSSIDINSLQAGIYFLQLDGVKIGGTNKIIKD